jgi:hypothetical protein
MTINLIFAAKGSTGLDHCVDYMFIIVGEQATCPTHYGVNIALTPCPLCLSSDFSQQAFLDS